MRYMRNREARRRADSTRAAPARAIPRGIYVISLLIGFTTAVGIAAAAGALSGDDQRLVEDENRGGPQTKRVEVARGKTGKLGEFRLLRSRGPEGECLGLQLVNPPGAVTPAGAEGVVYEGCGPRDDDFEISTLNDTDFTLVYGMVPEPTETVDVTSRGEATRNVRALEGEIGRDYVVTTLAGGARGVEVQPRDEGGRPIARRKVRPPLSKPAP